MFGIDTTASTGTACYNCATAPLVPEGGYCLPVSSRRGLCPVCKEYTYLVYIFPPSKPQPPTFEFTVKVTLHESLPGFLTGGKPVILSDEQIATFRVEAEKWLRDSMGWCFVDGVQVSGRRVDKP